MKVGFGNLSSASRINALPPAAPAFPAAAGCCVVPRSIVSGFSNGYDMREYLCIVTKHEYFFSLVSFRSSQSVKHTEKAI